MSNDSVDIEDLRRQVERLTKDREREEQAKGALGRMRSEMDEIKPSGWGAEVAKAQDVARAERARCIAERDRLHAERMAASAPKRAKLRARIDDIRAAEAAEQERHRAVVARYHAYLAELAAKVRPLVQELQELETPPEPPLPDYTEANRLMREAITPVGWVDPPARPRRAFAALRGGR